ncbi:hypothetical protein EYF80_014022 [Liparis tanakae]|uniref:Uncharacterized protein n=1 Tax=Liparis tanakae TaxID=230148 RepID=A0A4Z2IC87_9TELE|nr:hypothetical protein EYF80_014022 [Liparis tanakae]
MRVLNSTAAHSSRPAEWGEEESFMDTALHRLHAHAHSKALVHPSSTVECEISNLSERTRWVRGQDPDGSSHGEKIPGQQEGSDNRPVVSSVVSWREAPVFSQSNGSQGEYTLSVFHPSGNKEGWVVGPLTSVHSVHRKMVEACSWIEAAVEVPSHGAKEHKEGKRRGEEERQSRRKD